MWNRNGSQAFETTMKLSSIINHHASKKHEQSLSTVMPPPFNPLKKQDDLIS